MIRKIALTSVAALALITLTAQAESEPVKIKQGGMQNKMMKKKRMMMQSPFLIKHGLPHYTKMLMKSWDDPKLALTAEQKEKLMVVRKETMGSVMKLKPEVMKLRKEIVMAAKSGTKAADLKEKVEKLASLEAEATMTHLKCIEQTESILKPEQLAYLKQKAQMNRMQKKQKMMSTKQGGMKCAAGKCGGAK